MVNNYSNNTWFYNHINDPYVKLARKDGYRARSVYKLQEIDEKDKLIKPGQIIIDLGCAPGSWSQYLYKKLHHYDNKKKVQSLIIGIDILLMEPIFGVKFLCGDFTNFKLLNQLDYLLNGRKVDLVVSDIAPNLSGIKYTDSSNIEFLCNNLLQFTRKYLKLHGTLLTKYFYGYEHNEIINKFKVQFEKTIIRKPSASRKGSSEFFVIGQYQKYY